MVDVNATTALNDNRLTHPSASIATICFDYHPQPAPEKSTWNMRQNGNPVMAKCIVYTIR